MNMTKQQLTKRDAHRALDKRTSSASVRRSRYAERVGELVARGLWRYGLGDLPGALAEWRHALVLDPHCAVARTFVDHVLTRFARLLDILEEDKQIVRLSAELDVPIGLWTANDEREEEDYVSLEVQRDEATARPLEASGATTPNEEGEQREITSSVDDGWLLDQEAEAA